MIPKEKELVDFIKKRDLVNFSVIAKYFDIQNITVSDLIKDLEKKKLVTIKKLGGSKIVRLRK
jgi:Mn-dependent DtxR family transcriptional regulator